MNRPIFFLFPLILYLLAVNPWFLPNFYDNVVMFEGARNLATEGRYFFQQQLITDWPPLTSALLALPMLFGVFSVTLSKYLMVAVAGLAVWTAHRLFITEQRASPYATCMIFALMPTAMLFGTRIASEWPFMLCSFGCLLQLARMQHNRALPRALLCGLLLGLAAITRNIGVVLGAALLTQMVQQRRRNNSFLPEVIAAFTGAAIWMLWLLAILHAKTQGNAALGNYEREGLSLFAHINPVTLVEQLGESLFKSGSLLSVFEAERFPLTLAPGLVVLFALAQSLRQRLRPSDAYVLATLAVIGCYAWKEPRYFIPIAPFLISYVLKLMPQRLLRPIQISWGLTGATVCLILILFGTPAGNHGSLSPLISRNPQTFYRQYWLEQFNIAQSIQRDTKPGPIAVCTAGPGKYFVAWTGRAYTSIPSDEPPRYIFCGCNETEAQRRATERYALGLGFTLVKHNEHLLLFKADDPLRTHTAGDQ